MTSRWWTPLCLLAIAGWAATIFAGTYVWPGGESGGRYAAVAYGAAFFGLLFAYGIVRTRRAQLRPRHELFERLALTPVTPDVLRASTRGLFRIGYVYFTLGVIVTALGLGAVAAYGSAWESRLLYIAIAVVVVWLVYMIYALRAVTTASDVVFAPLGLRLASMPRYRVDWLHDISSVEGAVSYVGTRHGRDVALVLGMGESVTTVSGATAASAPTSEAQMADLTGEDARNWRNVKVSIDDGDVLVRRTARDAGRWMLHDLLLAEAIATRSVTTR